MKGLRNFEEFRIIDNSIKLPQFLNIFVWMEK